VNPSQPTARASHRTTVRSRVTPAGDDRHAVTFWLSTLAPDTVLCRAPVEPPRRVCYSEGAPPARERGCRLSWDRQFLANVASIVVIDLLLAGDNAVVIAMAVRGLPRQKRRTGILFGAGAAVIIRVALTFFVAQLLAMPFVKLAGGALILWIATKLFLGGGEEEGSVRRATGTWDAIKLIVVADVTMSLDNMLAVGGASQGHLSLLVFGLALSIPFIVFTSGLLSRLMDRFPIILYAGAAILGKVAAEMILTDPFTQARLHPSHVAVYAAEAVLAVGIIVAGKLWARHAGRPEGEVG
jgi:YjbE family integral membrane protein